MDRRDFGRLTLGAMLLGPMASWPVVSLAANPTDQKLHGLSAFGELGYEADYSHFDYVDPDAPKAGLFNFGVSTWGYNQNPQTFDTLNSFVLKGNAPPRMELCFDTLMVRAVDEPSAIYGAVAETVEISADRNSYTFTLRSGPEWHNGTPLTAEDVAYSYMLLKEKGHPEIAISLVNLDKAEAVDKRTVQLIFNGKQSDRSILSVALMPILSKAYYEVADFDASTLVAPLSSGPYRVGRVQPGAYIEYERVENYWGRDLGFSKGQNNFDTLRIEFFRDRQAAFEAFKKGNILFREEFTSKTWATEYDFPARTDGRVVKTTFPGETIPSHQGWAVNQRRSKFSDPRTAQAIGLCFDFEWTNENLFFNAYQRATSFFENSEFVAKGKAPDDERALLESLNTEVDPTVFDEPPAPLVTDGTGRDRSPLKQANTLLLEAGWVRQDGKLVDSNGQVLTVEFLIRSPTFERILGKFVSNLQSLGVGATIRLVDPAQFQKRLETFDFDIVGIARRYSATPTSEDLEKLFGTAAVSRPGSTNYAGVSNLAVDALIEKMDGVKSRKELTVFMRALDRVLRSTHSWIPNWTSANHRVAYWDIFGFPTRKPDYAFPVETTWWWDAKKAKAVGKG